MTLSETPLRSTCPASSPSAGARLKAHRPRVRAATALRTAAPVVTSPRPEQRTPRREERQSQARRYGPGAGVIPEARRPQQALGQLVGVRNTRREAGSRYRKLADNPCQVPSRFITPGINVWPHELKTAEALAEAGHVVEFVRRSEEKRAKSADALIDGGPCERKPLPPTT